MILSIYTFYHKNICVFNFGYPIELHVPYLDPVLSYCVSLYFVSPVPCLFIV